ncbi:glycosyltransferase [Paeniroseomonas aquatica]|uniref:Glycosyltransferase n=1 Tax=Paeniroseomonas aquatica TaxID=373043 RepID=A0ABT8A1M8_9PROT|nr:glycosyltransferase [Paeniroseomonas aquatica]MDN3563398.1 glycosyltransferase [Paeniroseomonas aquatica]
MFTAELPVIDYRDPWMQSFDTRLLQLARGHPRVAYFYEAPDTSTFRYRVFNMIEALAECRPDIGAAWFCSADLEHMETILDRCDTLVICRMRYSLGLARLIAAARSRGRRVLFDVDDLIFDARFTHLVLETLDQEVTDAAFDFWYGYIGRVGGTMRLCDGVILTNEYLAARATEFCGLPTSVVPNFLNGRQRQASADILERKRASGFRRDRDVTIGYFSGTPTHNRDFALAADSLAELMLRDSRIRLRLVGFMEARGRLAALGDRIERFPLQDFLNLQRLIGQVELNIVPLQDNTFTNCKSELKVFEAAVVGTISVASPSFTLRRAVVEGETGYLAPAQSWDAALERALARLDDYPTMAEAAAEAADRQYRASAYGDAIAGVLFR